MYELLLFVCLISRPDDCHEKRLPFQEPMGIMECMRQSQLQLPRWQEQHPNLVVKRWRCTPPEA